MRAMSARVGLAALVALTCTILTPEARAQQQAAVPAPAAGAASIETPAREAILLDAATGAVLLDRNADQRMPPSSMSKLLTAYVAFERLASGALSLEDTFSVSEKAWRMGGSKMFVQLGARVSVEDLLRGIIIQSGNDACIVLAEGIAGSEEAFAEVLNETAQRIGMANSHFTNASGWPDPEHYVTARDLARLAQRLITDFPQFYDLYGEKEFTYNGIKQGNRNPLLYRNIGADGLKTGHTSEAGYGLTASAIQGDRRLILVVNGLDSMQQRADETDRLLSWGFANFDNYRLVGAGQAVGDAQVWLGKSAVVPVVAGADLLVTLPRTARRAVDARLVYAGPLPAPITKGAKVGEIVVRAPGLEPARVPAIAAADVDRLGTVGRVLVALEHLIAGEADAPAAPAQDAVAP